MQLKKCKTNDKNRPHPFKQHSKMPPLLHITSKQSQPKSNTSTHLSQRSNSTRKLFLPKSHKLSHFFNQSISQHTSRKTMTSAEPIQYKKFRPADKKQANMGQRIEFLKFKVNKDYFDDQVDERPLRENISKQLNLNRNSQYQQRYQSNRNHHFSSCTSSGQNSYSAKQGIQSEKEIGRFPRMKSPRTLVHPVAKIMQKSREKGKIYSAQSLEFTFGGK